MNANERRSFHSNFENALIFVTNLHAEQVRKETDIPYVSHLLGVAGKLITTRNVHHPARLVNAPIA